MNIREVVARWLDTTMPHRQGSQLGKVLAFGSGAGEGSYSAKVRILRAGNLQETDRILEDVPVSPIWAGPDGTGVYAPLPVDTLVVVSYVEFNPAYPYVQGVWGEFYDAAGFQPEEFLIKGKQILLNGDSLGGLVKVKELKTNLEKNVAILQAMLTVLTGLPINEAGNGNPSSLQAVLKMALTGKLVGDFSRLENKAVKHGG